MRTSAVVALQTTTAASVNGTTIIDVGQVVNISVTAYVTGGTTTAGSYTLQVSNDIPPNGQRETFVPTNWTGTNRGTATSTIVAGVPTAALFVGNLANQFARVIFTRTAGSASETLTCIVSTAGV